IHSRHPEHAMRVNSESDVDELVCSDLSEPMGRVWWNDDYVARHNVAAYAVVNGLASEARADSNIGRVCLLIFDRAARLKCSIAGNDIVDLSDAAVFLYRVGFRRAAKSVD